MDTLRVAFLGFFAVWFLLTMVLGFFLFLDHSPSWLPNSIQRYGLFYGMVVFAVGWVAYFWDLFHNPAVPKEKRRLWAVVLFFAGPWAMPFYFWFYVRHSGRRSSIPFDSRRPAT